jgi:hypothetical protein
VHPKKKKKKKKTSGSELTLRMTAKWSGHV